MKIWLLLIFAVLAIATCVSGFILRVQKPHARSMNEAIICANNLKRLGFALSLYRFDEGSKYPSNFETASNIIGRTMVLHFISGAESTPLSDISLTDADIRAHTFAVGAPDREYFFTIDGGGDHLDGGTASLSDGQEGIVDFSKAKEAKVGLFVETNGTPSLLICPSDHNHKAATSWGEVTPANVSYKYLADQFPQVAPDDEVVAMCMIHSNVLLGGSDISGSQVDNFAGHPERLVTKNGHLYLKR